MTEKTEPKKKTKTPRSADTVAIDKVRSALEGLDLSQQIQVLEFVQRPIRDARAKEFRAEAMNSVPQYLEDAMHQVLGALPGRGVQNIPVPAAAPPGLDDKPLAG